jgi:hypothetical protein
MYQIAFREAALAIYQKIPSLRTVAQLLGISHSDAGYTPPVHAPNGEHPREYAH